MSQNINVSSQSIADSLSQFEAEMAKMNTLFNEIKTGTTDVKNYWEGEASDAMLAEIETVQQSFEQVEQQNQKYTSFLNSVIDKYTAADQSISNSASNSEGLSVNGS